MEVQQWVRLWVHRKNSTCETALGDALHVFWNRASRGEPRMRLLKEYAGIAVSRFAAYREVRKGKYKRPGHGGTCWACQAETQRLVCHHIIQVQHGGRNTKKNLVWVCRVCHARIHPWLKPAPPPKPEFDPTPRLVR